LGETTRKNWGIEGLKIVRSWGLGSRNEKWFTCRFTAHSSSREDSFETPRALREDGFSGESVRGRFSRSPRPSAINMPERLRTFDLSREVPGANQKQFPLCDLRAFAVKLNNIILSIKSPITDNCAAKSVPAQW
jgi:hypothetical protein